MVAIEQILHFAQFDPLILRGKPQLGKKVNGVDCSIHSQTKQHTLFNPKGTYENENSQFACCSTL